MIAWRLWAYGNQLSKDVTEYLKLPQAPFVYVMSLFAGLAGLVELYRAVRPTPPQDSLRLGPCLSFGFPSA